MLGVRIRVLSALPRTCAVVAQGSCFSGAWIPTNVPFDVPSELPIYFGGSQDGVSSTKEELKDMEKGDDPLLCAFFLLLCLTTSKNDIFFGGGINFLSFFGQQRFSYFP